MDEPISNAKSAEHHRLDALWFGLLERVGQTIPLRALRWLGSVAAAAAWAARARSRAVTEVNVRLAFPELTSTAQQRLAKDSLRESGRLAMESVGVWSRRSELVLEWIVEVEGAELLSSAMAQGQGVICLVPHFGNWEVLCVYLASKSSFATVYERQRIAWVDRWIANGRRRSGARVAPATISGLRLLRRALLRGEVVGLLPDQVPALGQGVSAPFFGQPALTPTLAWRLATTSGAPVLVASARRCESPAGFSIRFTRFDASWAAMEERAALRAMNQAIEEVVRQAPAQYQWEYKRFKHAEPGVDKYKQG